MGSGVERIAVATRSEATGLIKGILAEHNLGSKDYSLDVTRIGWEFIFSNDTPRIEEVKLATAALRLTTSTEGSKVRITVRRTRID